MFNRNEKYAHEKGYRMDKDGTFYSPKGNVVRGYLNNGYRKYKLRVPGDYNKCLHFKLSRFQAYCKFGDKIYEKGFVVRHLNGVRDDDSWDNIEIGTQSENIMDCPKEDRVSRAVNASRSNVKYSRETILKIRADRELGMSYRQLQKKHNVPNGSSMNYILYRENIN